MLEEAVLRDRDTVVESVVELEGLVTAQSVWSDRIINDFDVEYLMRESLKKYSDVPQVIEGKKTIKNNLYTLNAAITGLLQSEIVNGFNVLEINRTLVRINDDNFIEGATVMEADVEIDSLFVPGKIHDVYVDDLVYDGDSRTIESARFETMEIASNLYVDYVNDVNLDEFLKSTIKLNGPEQHIYEDVVFGGLKVDECKLDSINGMPFDNIVVDSVYDRVDVYGDKVFMQDTQIRGPAFVDILNSFDVRQMYQNTVFSNDDVVIDGHVIFKAPVAIKGNIEASETVNRVKLKDSMNSGIQRIEETRKVADELIWHTQNNINNFLNEINDLSVEFLYADVINDVEIFVSEFKTTNVKSYKNQAILNFNAYNPGTLCNLQTFCLCPKHYAMRIFEDGSSVVFQETETPMRIFDLLAPNGISIELITTTLSLSRECLSAAEANLDKSWIYWRREDQSETFSTDIRQFIPGFISDVKSFYSDGQYYAVVSQYYDVTMDTFNLDTVVLRLDIHKKQVTLIQRIPSYASWVLDITQTTRGIQLVVGNTFDSVKRSSDVESQILRFNPALVQFEFIQSILTSGCKSIVTVTIKESHMFIIISQNNYEPLMIWKHDGDTNRYSLYQSLTFEATVKSLAVAEVSNKNKHEPLLCVTTFDEKLHIYQHTFSEKWKRHTSGYFPGIQGVVHFSIATEHYLLAMSQKRSKIMWLVAQGVF
ncbi:uncharacterized protein LOC143914682 [Arctopsyche grandis]|uniref:uncharacterized protein LOC143914682 n=1 Tax=Arctopsyche grandis TaxID=121162 RepID=UPI00406D96D6